jgi:hypothetical protein
MIRYHSIYDEILKTMTLKNWRPALVAALSLTLLTALSSTAYAVGSNPQAVVKCGTSITSCGCTIKKPGFYEVDADLDSTQGLNPNGDCLSVKASKVTLFLNGHPITGPGGSTPSGVGLHLLPSASKVFVEGGDGANIDGWDVGVLVEGNKNSMDWLEVDDNGTAGFELNKAKNNNINDFVARNNNNYGVWLRASNNNEVNCATSSSNANVNFYVGCSANGPTSSKCKGVGNSTGNRIYDFSTGGSDYGVALDLGSTKTTVTDSYVRNPSHNSIYDFFDANSSCDKNQWFGNDSSATTSQSCIQ